jgi:hypothetical protein
VGCGIPSTSRRATTRQPGGRAGRRTLRFRRGLPPAQRVVGLCQVDGIPHGPQRARSSVITLSRSFGHFTVTKHIQTTQEDHRRRAFAVAKPAGNRCYPRPRILGFWVRSPGGPQLNKALACDFSHRARSWPSPGDLVWGRRGAMTPSCQTLTSRDVDPVGFQKSACAADRGGRCGQPSGHDRGSVQHSSAARPCVA